MIHSAPMQRFLDIASEVLVFKDMQGWWKKVCVRRCTSGTTDDFETSSS